MQTEKAIKRRTFDESVDYVIERIFVMPIGNTTKVELAGMIMALQYIHEVEIADAKHKAKKKKKK